MHWENRGQDRCQELDRVTGQLGDLVADGACDELFASAAQCHDQAAPEIVISMEYRCHGYSFREVAAELERKLLRTIELHKIRKNQWKST